PISRSALRPNRRAKSSRRRRALLHSASHQRADAASLGSDRMKPVALIIDDEAQIRRLLRVVLEGEDYQVHEAETGQQGLIEIANLRPATILLDLGLPDLDGLEVLK